LYDKIFFSLMSQERGDHLFLHMQNGSHGTLFQGVKLQNAFCEVVQPCRPGSAGGKQGWNSRLLPRDSPGH
uniref:Uncharacterized protein n=1 Tax=Nothoprocta perdicaria TaxID=30464 RepID=A0A8C6ZTZ5_NOTPE